ncbi:MAG: glutamate racemase [Bacteroidota bacterium]|nr:glutamate racemase [Bacteroidota bacterium]
MADNRPIGIFDSGIGGLTIARAVHELLPNEQMLFFGDTAHFPYGDKSGQAIRGYVNGISDFLLAKGCKAILIACNSASASAYDSIRKKDSAESPVINVIDPVIDYLSRHSGYKTIGVIGTQRTISSGVYKRKIESSIPGMKVKSLATPLLAPMIEEGFFNNNISQAVINSYLDKKRIGNIDALILACTHYPLIRKEIESYYAGKVAVLNPANIIAGCAQKRLKEQGLEAAGKQAEGHQFFVSDYTQSFQKTSQLFFGEEIRLEECRIWQEKAGRF